MSYFPFTQSDLAFSQYALSDCLRDRVQGALFYLRQMIARYRISNGHYLTHAVLKALRLFRISSRCSSAVNVLFRVGFKLIGGVA